MTKNSLKITAGIISVLTALLLASIKLYYALLSGSVGILASMLDSTFDMISSAIILVALVTAVKPADHDHRFGHGKAEALAGFLQSALIFCSALYILYAAVRRFLNPAPLESIGESIVVMALATSITLGLVLFQGHVARKTESVAVKADRLHYLTDLLAGIVVVVSLIAEKYWIPVWPDLFAAVFISAYIIKSSSTIFKESLDILMDRDISERYHALVTEFIADNQGRIVGYHDLRARSAGSINFLEIHLEMRRDLSLVESHSLAEDLIGEFKNRYRNLDVMVHTDPVEIHPDTGAIRSLD